MNEVICAEQTRWRKLYLIAALGILAVVAWLLIRWFWFPGQAFDPIGWQDPTQIEQGVRLGMADRMIARRVLLGKSRAEVIELLGEPTPTGHFAEWDMVYWLGPERAYFSIDSEWLVLRLAENGRVVDRRIVRD